MIKIRGAASLGPASVIAAVVFISSLATSAPTGSSSRPPAKFDLNELPSESSESVVDKPASSTMSTQGESSSRQIHSMHHGDGDRLATALQSQSTKHLMQATSTAAALEYSRRVLEQGEKLRTLLDETRKSQMRTIALQRQHTESMKQIAEPSNASYSPAAAARLYLTRKSNKEKGKAAADQSASSSPGAASVRHSPPPQQDRRPWLQLRPPQETSSSPQSKISLGSGGKMPSRAASSTSSSYLLPSRRPLSQFRARPFPGSYWTAGASLNDQRMVRNFAGRVMNVAGYIGARMQSRIIRELTESEFRLIAWNMDSAAIERLVHSKAAHYGRRK